jgi:hypothetical protein
MVEITRSMNMNKTSILDAGNAYRYVQNDLFSLADSFQTEMMQK